MIIILEVYRCNTEYRKEVVLWFLGELGKQLQKVLDERCLKNKEKLPS
jgi:hypothetical protein